MQETASFWTDIKVLEEQLNKSPDSYCFARLAEVYLKVGLIDDALHVVRKGVSIHPGYISGQRVLSQACHAKGLNADALAALRVVTGALPEDVASQKLMGRLLAEEGDQAAACQAFRVALEFAPEDVECRIELESLTRSSGMPLSAPEADEDTEEVIEDLEILEELEIFDEDELEQEPEPEPEHLETQAPVEMAESQDPPVSHHDPLSTGTLAELYVSQGFIHKALEIYRTILADNPGDLAVATRVIELESLDVAPMEHDSEIENIFDEKPEEEPEEEQVSNVPIEALFQAPSEVQTDSARLVEFEKPPISENISGFGAVLSPVPETGTADNALSTLDRWLENIRRIKSCR